MTAYKSQWSALKGRAAGFRSGLEELVAEQLKRRDIKFTYEGYTLKYEVPARITRYKPDFVLPNGIIVETKGRFVTSDRTKHRLIKEQYPELDIRFVFSDPNAKIGKKSKTTYAMWCDRLGIPWAKKLIPDAWLAERPIKARVEAAKRLLGWHGP